MITQSDVCRCHADSKTFCGLIHKHGLALIQVYMSNRIHYKVWDEITYPLPNLKCTTVNVWEWWSDSSHTLWGVWLILNAGITVNPWQWKGVPVSHDDIIKWKHFLRYWPFVWGIHRSPVNLHKGQRLGALMFSLICAWLNGWVNNREAGDMRRYRTHYDVTAMNTHMILSRCQHIIARLQLFWMDQMDIPRFA